MTATTLSQTRKPPYLLLALLACVILALFVLPKPTEASKIHMEGKHGAAAEEICNRLNELGPSATFQNGNRWLPCVQMPNGKWAVAVCEEGDFGCILVTVFRTKYTELARLARYLAHTGATPAE